MSHHFDTPTAREDPRINVCDFYLFRGRPGSTVMAMTVNPNAGQSAPDTFRDEGLYAFRFDLNGDAREELSFTLRFSAVSHSDGDNHAHVQSFEVRRASGPAAASGADGELIASGQTGGVVEAGAGVKAFAGLAPDLFAGDAMALGEFRTAFFEKGTFHPQAFQNRKNFFAGRNVTAIVLEVPTPMIGRGRVRGWATASLHGHAPEVQVSRWGLPLMTNIFMPDPAMREDFNRAAPAEDVSRFSAQVADIASRLTRLAGSAADPAGYGQMLGLRLCPVTLPYELDTAANFSVDAFNGRGLADDVMDVMLTLATNTPLSDGVAPDRSRMRDEFPYFGEPYKSSPQPHSA
ncbi:MAG: DUF4331 family protein [Hyphomicrobiales bacterium]|nr:DUF4331 family protein [Hyphomicrobiales bacterium]